MTGYQQVDGQGAVISQATYTLDALGRATGQTLTYGSGASAITKTLSQTWNADGQKASFTYPDGSQTRYAYQKGLLNQVTLPNGQTITWNGYQWNAPTQITYPGATRSLSYDPLLRPLSIQVTNTANQTLMNRGYQYDLAGNIIQRDSEDGPTTYGYDALDRLTQVNPSDTLKQKGLPQEGYTYDGVHNRTFSLHQPGAWVYNADNQLLQWGAGSELTTLTYTATGHTETETKGGNVRTYRYNAAERLVEVRDNGVTIAQYVYDPLGRRIAKAANGQTIWFLYGDNGLVAEMDAQGNVGKAYGWGPDTTWGGRPLWQAEVSVTQAVSASPLYLLYTDHLGTPRVAASVTGALAWKGVAEEFGKTFWSAGQGIGVNLRFPGQYFDVETGVNNNYFRDYDPQTGRYIQSDPIGLNGGINTYGYVDGNPLGFVDPEGLKTIRVWCWLCTPILGGSGGRGSSGASGTGDSALDDALGGGAASASSYSGATSQTNEQCPPEKPCDPPVGTQCWSIDVDSTPHKIRDYLGTKLGKRGTCHIPDDCMGVDGIGVNGKRTSLSWPASAFCS